MQLGIFAKTFPGTSPAPVLAAVRSAGFTTTQYNMACSGLAAMPKVIQADDARAVADAARASGVQVIALSGTYNMIHPDPAVRQAGHERLAVLAEAAAAIGSGLITLCTGTRDPEDQWRAHPGNDAPDAWRDLLEAMTTAIGIADHHDVDLGIEPELANVVSSAARARRMIDELGSPRLKIILDPANLFETASLAEQHRIVAAGIDLLADRIVMGHAKDRTAAGEFTTAGQGVLDYPHYLACLRRAGFAGPIVAHGLSAAEAAPVAAFLRRAAGEAGVDIQP